MRKNQRSYVDGGVGTGEGRDRFVEILSEGLYQYLKKEGLLRDTGIKPGRSIGKLDPDQAHGGDIDEIATRNILNSNND